MLSQRFSADVGVDPFTVYRALRHVNPSPYMFFVRMGGRSIVGSSPEMLVRVEGRHAVTHPIAGTRPRGRTEEEDQRLADELKRNEKERAEHVMLVDLGRNDLGRVCQYGSVRVPTFMALERYSHVMHLVSVVEGQLADDSDRLDALVVVLSGRHGVGRAEGAGDADHQRRSSRRRAASTPARSATWTSPATSTSASRSAPIVLEARPGVGASRRRHRRRLESDRGVRRDARQGARDDAGARARAVGAVTWSLVIDNYDSFTYNLVQYLGELGAEVSVRRNDETTVDEIAALQPIAHPDFARAGPTGRRRRSRST